MSLFGNTLRASEEGPTLPGNSEDVEREKRKGKKEGRWAGGWVEVGARGEGRWRGCVLRV